MNLKRCHRCGGTYLHRNELDLCAECARKITNAVTRDIVHVRIGSNHSDNIARSKRDYINSLRAQSQYA